MAGVETGSCREGKEQEETGSTRRLAQADVTSRLTPHKHKFYRQSLTGARNVLSREEKSEQELSSRIMIFLSFGAC